VAVSYEYHATNFRVTFQRLSREAAQGVLNEWATATELAALHDSAATGLLARA
jgi:hypothetical protein